ncbi:MAG: 3-deoxy-7-phosphoheptulonate synthase [bacterium]
MIYSFEKSDPALKTFLGLLQDSEVEYELIHRDRAVVRLLGIVEPEVDQRLQQVHASRLEPAPSATTGSKIFADFLDRDCFKLIAGPCAVESADQIAAVVTFLTQRGIRYIRGGAFKPRTSPDSFQGLGESGLKILAEQTHAAQLAVVSEAMDRSQLDVLCRYADIVQVGSRNMFNYTLLTALGSIRKPVLLKRGMAATIDEWLQAAEYIRRGGNHEIILCERGIRTFETRTRNTLDIAAIHVAQELTIYPVIADPSHAAGRSELVTPLALAAAAAGADGIMVEIHPDPAQALSDRRQALSFAQFDALSERLARIRPVPCGKR